MMERFSGKCDCGSVLDGPVSAIGRAQIEDWRDRHTRGVQRGTDFVLTGHTLLRDEFWQDESRELSEAQMERVRSGAGLERPKRARKGGRTA